MSDVTLSRNERTTLLAIWPDGQFPSGLVQEVRRRTDLWHKFGSPGPLPRCALLDIVAQFSTPDDGDGDDDGEPAILSFATATRKTTKKKLAAAA